VIASNSKQESETKTATSDEKDHAIRLLTQEVERLKKPED
jgi:hypothetical protein